MDPRSVRSLVVASVTFACAITATGAPVVDGVLLQVTTPHAKTRRPLPLGSVVTAANLPDVGADGTAAIRVTNDAGDAPQAVIVQLRGAPLATAVAGRGVAARRAARRSLESEHQRVIDEVARLESLPGRAASSALVRREFFTVFDGVAMTMRPATVAALRLHPDVAAIHPDRVVNAILDTSVAYVRAPQFWSSHGGFRGAGQVIAVVDTGIDYTHADLGSCVAVGSGCKVVGGYDFQNDDADPADDHGHGTHVAATAAGNGRLLGVAPDATLLAYKVLGADGSGLTSNVMAGIEAAVDPNGDLDTSDHADVVNLSLGGPGGPDDPSAQAVDAATAAGVIVVAAAGNSAAYFTVGSPGAARTAITVASISEDGIPAWTNSAGPVAGTFDLKPEVAAPGVSICAARAAGTGLGAECLDATHIEISGTSMATPHVAGAAALLHGVQPALPPEDVKSLIVQNGRPSTADFLQSGATILDVPAAAAAHTVVSPQTLSFGIDPVAVPVWQMTKTLTVRNIGATTRSYTLAAEGNYWGLPAGATVTFAPASFSLVAGASRTVAVELTVDNALVPTPAMAPWTYDARITLKSAGEDQIIPAIFLKAGLLRIHTDVPASLLYLHDRTSLSSAQVASPTGTTTEFLVAPGTYDVTAMFPGDLPSLVVHEAVVIAGETDETIPLADAVHTITLAGRDETGAPLDHTIRELSLYHRASGLGLSIFSSYRLGAFTIPVSRISDAYDLDVAVLAEASDRSYLVTKALAGVSASTVLDNTPAELTRGAQRYFADPGAPARDVTEFLSVMIGSAAGVGLGGYPPISPVDRDIWFTPSPREDSGVFLQSWVGLDGTTPGAHYCPWYQGSTAPGVIEACNPLDRHHPAYQTSTGELPLDLGPASFFLKMIDYGGAAMLQPVVAAWTWAFHSPGGDGPEAPNRTVGYRLLSGANVKASGVLAQSGFGGPTPPYLDLAPAGPYTFETDPLDYWIGGLRATSRVALSFDTTPAIGDATPPWLQRVEVRSDGALDEVVPTGGIATLDVEVHDDVEPGLSLTLARIEDGVEVPVPVVALGGGVFRAVMPHACDQAGPFNALLTATNAAGHQLREWLTPAFVCRPVTCGNGVVEAGEACDDGNLLPGDHCNAACSGTEICGDGVLDAGEACDDGNTTGGDCCSATCEAETAGGACDDGAFCNGSDRCDGAGSCARHVGSPCAGRAECNRGCDETADACTVSPPGPCRPDANACTDDVCDGAGTCTHPPNTGACDDGVFCNGPDTCSGGACSEHAGDPCTAVGECVGACNEPARSCFAPWGTPCTVDDSVCTWDTCNGAGECAHVPSNAGVVCRDGVEPCDVPEVCTGVDVACPGDTGIVDTDADTLCDGLDPCTNVAHAQDFASPPVGSLELGRMFAETVPHNDMLAVRGEFALPPSVTFRQLFPRGSLARVVLRNTDGTPAVDIALPNEGYSNATRRGWVPSRDGRKWTWRDRSRAPLGGITQLALRAIGASADVPGTRVRVAVSAKHGDFPFTAATVSVNVSITLGDAAAAAAGRCVESVFVPADCTIGSHGTKLTCRR